ncbi:DUF305 domain-containing protein [Halopiger xanaduensis]|uniref:DUF305 domain-containing protein n=1 Tax=Halopiger xanaduensis (strain DSM 18323 / JCM 14033 / SH-6) TaxID=797210 RepID=F8DBJ0_HALXS|nr:DUF305 domain-containing protein [Halopiger xanaduensis]AEH37113.1 protein of unknown function DUF305 [Halopiger xanaduensis SH-6]
MSDDTNSDETHDATRRSVLRNGPLASAGLALGLAGTAPAAADSKGTRSAASGSDLNLADVTFLQTMAYHHRGGIEAAQLVPERTGHDALREFSQTVIRNQRQGIDRIERILTDAGLEPGQLLEVDLDAVRDLVTSIPGNLRPNELAYLRTLEGTAFDLRFVERFANHHSGAIQLSQLVLQEGQSPAVEEMATDIIDAQRADIVQMYRWYLDWASQ